MKTRILAVLLTALMLLSLVACGGTPAASTAAPSTGDAPATTAEQNNDVVEQSYTVGVCQLVQHPALDAATQGFIDALNEALPGKVEVKNQNASGDAATCATIVNGYVSNKVDLIMANATPALQAAASATDTIPVLGTSITEYGVALDIDNFNGVVGTNVSGTSDLAPLDGQADMLHELFPDAKNVALIYCSSEANSQYQIDVMTEKLTALGYNCKSFTFTDSNDVTSVTQAAADFADVVYIPTDNTAASNTEAIANILIPAKIPAVCGEEGICEGCGVATLSISYYDLGVTTGKMAAKILTGEAKVSEMAIEYAPAVKKYNKANCEALGITVPADYSAIGE